MYCRVLGLILSTHFVSLCKEVVLIVSGRWQSKVYVTGISSTIEKAHRVDSMRGPD